MPNKPTSQFTAIATLDSADRIVAYEASESELRTVTGTVLLAWLGTSLDLSTIASGGALPVARGGTGITSLGTGVATFLGTPSSANLLAAITDETGTGALVFANSPTLVTPALGTPASGVLTNCTGLPVAGGGTGRATGTTAYALIATGTTATGAQQSLAAGATTDILVGGGASALPVWTTATGSGAPVRATSPALVTPTLGVASATSLACPTFTTASGAMGFTPAAGSNFNITLSGEGDFAVNTNHLYVDTSVGCVGIGLTNPSSAASLCIKDKSTYGSAIGMRYASGTYDTAFIAVSNSLDRLVLSGGAEATGNINVGATLGLTARGTNGKATIFQQSEASYYFGYATGLTNGNTFTPTYSLAIVQTNVGINTVTFGASASGVLAIKNGTQGAALTDSIQLVSEDLSAGNTILSLRTEGTAVYATGTPAAATGSVAIKINGTVLYFTVSTTAAS